MDALIDQVAHKSQRCTGRKEKCFNFELKLRHYLQFNNLQSKINDFFGKIWRKVGFSILIKDKDALINEEDNKDLTIGATVEDDEDESS